MICKVSRSSIGSIRFFDRGISYILGIDIDSVLINNCGVIPVRVVIGVISSPRSRYFLWNKRVTGIFVGI